MVTLYLMSEYKLIPTVIDYSRSIHDSRPVHHRNYQLTLCTKNSANNPTQTNGLLDASCGHRSHRVNEGKVKQNVAIS